jgi:hypothetical protein
MFDHVAYVLPSRPLAKWNGTECKAFLKSRGHVGYSKLNAEESKQMVRTMSLAADWPPPEVIPAGYSIRVDELQVMLRHCHSLFKHLFAEPHTPQHQHAADGHAKLLLSTITRLDRLMHPNGNLPNLYEVKYNFISLPRAVSLLSVYGSARNIQEGGTDGEGVVKMLRPLTPRGLKQHFARNLMDAYHRDQQLQELCEDVRLQLASTNSSTAGERDDIDRLTAHAEAELDRSEDDCMMEDSDETDEIVSNVYEMDTQQFKKYKTINLLREYCQLGIPLSFVVATVDAISCIGFVVGSSSSGHLVPLTIGNPVKTPTTGFAYFHITIHYDACDRIGLYNAGVQHHSVVNYGHLLPCLSMLDNEGTNVPYAIVTTDAFHMDSQYNFI